MTEYSFGADESPKDIRTFTYETTTANVRGGTRYEPKDIEDQHRVGICTAISLTQCARKATGKKYSADFQYLLQKKYHDKNWNEGSSALAALKTAHKYGFLLEEDFEKYAPSRKQPYHKYIAELQKISDKTIEKLLKKSAKNKLLAYEQIPVDRDLLANATDASESGIIVRFAVGKEWWTAPIEPLRPPKEIVSGHLIIDSNYNGGSRRVANTWGTDWADRGTAYYLLRQYKPTEAWLPYFQQVPDRVAIKLEKKETTIGKILNKVLKVVNIFLR